MKAVVIRRCGPPEALELHEVEKPTPRGSQVLVRLRAASVNPVDWKIRQGMLRPLTPRTFPFILGSDAAGEIEQPGPHATRWSVGDPVYFATGGSGAYAEYAAVEESHCAAKLERLSFEEAAAIPVAGLTALQSLRDKAGVQPGQRVLINGASGGVGTFAVQIAVALGCRATGVASTRNLDLVRQLGATDVIDYTQDDFTRQDRRYDVIFDVVPNRSFSKCRPLLNPGGVYVTTVPGPPSIAWSAATRLVNVLGYGKRCRWIIAKPRGSDLERLNEWIVTGQLRPILDRTYRLEEIVEAHRYSETGRVRGKIAIAIP